MEAKGIESGNGWVITKIGKDEGKIFLTDEGKQTKNSEKAAWFSKEFFANDFILLLDGSDIWKTVTW